MTTIEYSFRFAAGADVPNVAALVDAAYRDYVGRIGMLSHPMTDDYAEVNMPRRRGICRNARSVEEGKRVAGSKEGGACGKVVPVELVSVDGVIESPAEWASPTPTRRWRRRTQRGYPSTGPTNRAARRWWTT